MSQIKLYGFILCPFAQRVRFALESLKIKYDYQDVDLYKGKQDDEAYLAINPFGQVPSLVFNDECLYESLFLLEFIEDQFGGVFPTDNIRKAQQRIWVNYFNENVLSKVSGIFALFKIKDLDQLKAIANQIAEGIRLFTKHSKLSEKMQQNAKGYFEGDQLTYIDYAIIPHMKSLENFYQLVFKLEFFELIENDQAIKDFRRYYQNVIGSDAFKRCTYNLYSLPPQGDNYLLDSLQYTPHTFDYNTLFQLYITKKYIH